MKIQSTHLFFTKKKAVLYLLLAVSTFLRGQTILENPGPPISSKCVGGNITWSVTVQAPPAGQTLEFKWYYKQNAGANPTQISNFAGISEITTTSSAGSSISSLHYPNLLLINKGLYYVTVKQSNMANPVLSEAVELQVFNGTPQAVITAPAMLSCNNPTVTLFGGNSTQAQTYQWTFNGATISDSESAEASGPGTYTLKVTNPCGTNTATTMVSANFSLPGQVAITPNPPPVLTCLNQSGVVLLGNSSTPDFQYRWSGPGFPNVPANPISVFVKGTYTFKAIHPISGCVDSISVTMIEDKTPPAIVFDPSQPALCEGATLSLTASGGDTYKWSNGATTPGLDISTAGVYSVTVTNSQNGCTSTASKTVTVRETPSLSVMPGPDISISDGGGVVVEVFASPFPSTADWEIVSSSNLVPSSADSGEGDIERSFSLETQRTFGEAVIEITPNNQGCLGPSKTVTIKVLPEVTSGIFIPEILTPNGDGTNDLWNIITDDGVDIESISLFNRSGGKLMPDFASPEDWDLTKCPDGTYFYAIKLANNPKPVKGAVTLVRE